MIALTGYELDPWQRLVLDVSMGLRADESWAAKTVDVIASRQNGKNVIVEARELYGALVLGEQVTHTAHLFQTALKSFNRIKKLVASHPDLSEKLVRKLGSPAVGYSFEFQGGGGIEFIARSTQSGRGFTGDLLILDEAQSLGDEALGALLPTLAARSVEGDPQVWYLGSAPGLGSEVWQRRRKAGRAGGTAMGAFFEFSAEPDSDLDDRDVWAQANPGLNIHISEEFIEETERSSMSDEMFAQERLSISPDVEFGSGVIPRDAWNACESPASMIVDPVFMALDVTPERDWSSIASAGRSSEGGTHVEIVDHRRGTKWLIARAKQLQVTWGVKFAVGKGSPAASLLPDLEVAEVEVEVISTEAHAQACGALYDSVIQGTLKHLGTPELTAAVDYAKQRFVGDSWLWDRRRSGVISPLVAVTLAKWLHDQATEGPSVYEGRGVRTLG